MHQEPQYQPPTNRKKTPYNFPWLNKRAGLVSRQAYLSTCYHDCGETTLVDHSHIRSTDTRILSTMHNLIKSLFYLTKSFC